MTSLPLNLKCTTKKLLKATGVLQNGKIKYEINKQINKTLKIARQTQKNSGFGPGNNKNRAFAIILKSEKELTPYFHTQITISWN